MKYKGKTRAEWRRVAEKNGINENTFYTRIRDYGWNMEESATLKVGEPRDKYRRLALKNGINRNTYNLRLHRGWSKKEAATTPIKEKRKRVKPTVTNKEFYNLNTPKKVKEYIYKKPTLTRVETLSEITQLENERLLADKKRAKEIDREIYNLGKNLVIPRRQKRIKKIIKKGEEATVKEIEYLLMCGIPKSTICNLLNISETRFYRYYNDFLSDVI